MTHVLIVDDDPATRDTLAALAEAEGFTPAAAGSLREARVQMGRVRPDIVLIDLTVPEGAGTDRPPPIERFHRIEVVLMTGDASMETAVAALRSGVGDCLARPLTLDRVRGILSTLARPGGEPATGSTVTVPVGVSLEEAGRQLILATLQQCGGVKKQAAARLGVSLKTLYNRLEEYRARGLLPASLQPRAGARRAAPAAEPARPPP